MTGWRIQATDVKEEVLFHENGIKGQAPLTVARFRVTFTHPGIFNYIRALHDELGMVGQVIVLPWSDRRSWRVHHVVARQN